MTDKIDFRANCKTCGKKEHQFRDGSEIDCRSWKEWICRECHADIIRESDGYSDRNGRNDNGNYDEYNTRLNDGFNLESMAYKEY